MNNLRQIKPRGFKSGFTLLEIIVALCIISVIAGISYPVFSRYLPNARVRAAARELDSVLQKARLRAAITQRPVRVVVNCVKNPVVNESCLIRFQIAVSSGTGVSDWTDNPVEMRVLHKDIVIINGIPGSTSVPDGAESYTDVHWAIFMPNNQVFSDPRPFNLFIYYSDESSGQTSGWRVSINNTIGRVHTERAELTLP
jgi:prepilin-type N-terminal cleavage/methylation domain-containing protein